VDFGPTMHATAVLVGSRAILIRGPSGSGKSRLALDLLQAGLPPRLTVRLIADDRVLVQAAHGRVIVRQVAATAGLLEVRGSGIHRVPHEAMAVVSRVVDLAADDAGRIPTDAARRTRIAGIELPRLAVASGSEPLPLVLAVLTLPEPAEAELPLSRPQWPAERAAGVL
jgi:HPr kinase/phosphorylase